MIYSARHTYILNIYQQQKYNYGFFVFFLKLNQNCMLFRKMYRKCRW